MQEQNKHNSDQVELFVTAASIVTGSIMMASFATASVRILAARGMINAIAATNIDRIWNLMAVANNSKPFMFGVGKLLDETKGRLREEVVSAIAEVAKKSNDHQISIHSPAVESAHLEAFLRFHLNNNQTSALNIYNSKILSDNEKYIGFQKLSKSPICLSPTRGVNEQRLALQIELSLWMSLILNSDELTNWPEQPYGDDIMASVRARSQPIPQLPGAADYPHPAPAKYTASGRSAYQSIGINRPGSVIRTRIDEVCYQVFKRKFYNDHGLFGGPSAGERQRELLAARHTMNLLAVGTQPHSWADVNLV
jgi:hypothetical protein